MQIKGKENALMAIMAVLWLAVMVLGWTNHYLVGMIVAVFLMLTHMLMGVAKNGKVSSKFLVYPLIIWTILWIASFCLSDYYAALFAGKMPTFNVAGFHPSFAPTFFMYYLGGMATLTVGFAVFQNEWLSDQDWENFLERVKKNKMEEPNG